jgi:hypothetical protein
MTEMACASKNHRNAMLVCSCNDLVITHAATWLNGAACTTVDDNIQTIAEWEKCITGYCGAF